MCGIAGILYREADRQIDRRLLERMSALIRHRGPDEDGLFAGRGVGLAHRRLSIIDLAAGQQPMHDEPTRRTIVFNGEIYNYREVRASGRIACRTNSDTEVLLKVADFDAVDWVERLNGMFAFAIWDARSETLMLGRDRLGKKPLYYAMLDGEFIFASEIKPLLIHPGMKRAVATDAIPEYLAFRTSSGCGTLFEGIRQVPPGHLLLLSRRGFEPVVKRYWREGEGKTLGDYVDPNLPIEDQFEQLLRDAVRYRLLSEVPVGSFNSGGVDSSLNSAIMRSLTQGEMHTFSVAFKEPEYNEGPYAERVARQLGTHHHTLLVEEQQYLEHLDETLLYLEEPINHAHTVQLLLLSRFAKQYVTVALTGEGSDEVFGGYPRLQIPVLSQYLSRVPGIVSKALLAAARAARMRKLTKLLETAGDTQRSIIENARYVPEADLHLALPGPQDYPERERVFERARAQERSTVGRALYFDQRTYLPSLLMRLDKSSMAAALECRVPFLDPNILEWSRKIPDRYKIRPGTASKFLVKKVAERWLPKDIVYRKKVGFATPIGEWLRNPKGLGARLDLITDQTFRARGYFDAAGVARLVSEHLRREADHAEVLWGVLNFEMWCRRFIDDNRTLDALAPEQSAGPGRALSERAAAVR
jgi:asparagine synthase (glutamine-hydrolysing)